MPLHKANDKVDAIKENMSFDSDHGLVHNTGVWVGKLCLIVYCSLYGAFGLEVWIQPNVVQTRVTWHPRGSFSCGSYGPAANHSLLVKPEIWPWVLRACVWQLGGEKMSAVVNLKDQLYLPWTFSLFIALSRLSVLNMRNKEFSVSLKSGEEKRKGKKLACRTTSSYRDKHACRTTNLSCSSWPTP